MIAFIAFSTLFTMTLAQWGGHNQQQPQSYQQQPQQSYQQPPQQQSYQQPQQSYQQPPQQQYQQPPQQPQRTYNPAPVHYVNIGAELAGDYKFGYDTGKGQDGQSFREETRLPDGSVQGAYGYVDDQGKQRIVRYTAGKNGYQVDQGDGKAPAQQAPQQQQQYAPAPNNNYNSQGRYH